MTFSLRAVSHLHCAIQPRASQPPSRPLDRRIARLPAVLAIKSSGLHAGFRADDSAAAPVLIRCQAPRTTERETPPTRSSSLAGRNAAS
jgi:hypothetical protein